jgi:hypothetical protein
MTSTTTQSRNALGRRTSKTTVRDSHTLTIEQHTTGGFYATIETVDGRRGESHRWLDDRGSAGAAALANLNR